MKLRSRPTAALITFLVLFAGGYALYRLVLASHGKAPEEFASARAEGALVAQTIVTLSNEVSGALQAISTLDKERRYEEALAAVTALSEKNENMREQAIRLSQEMEKMARALPQIESVEARDIALESINNRIELITRLISYNDGVMRLLNELRLKFSGAHFTGEDVAGLINQINLEVAAINDFNTRATEAMDRFDRAMK